MGFRGSGVQISASRPASFLVLTSNAAIGLASEAERSGSGGATNASVRAPSVALSPTAEPSWRLPRAAAWSGSPGLSSGWGGVAAIPPLRSGMTATRTRLHVAVRRTPSHPTSPPTSTWCSRPRVQGVLLWGGRRAGRGRAIGFRRGHERKRSRPLRRPLADGRAVVAAPSCGGVVRVARFELRMGWGCGHPSAPLRDDRDADPPARGRTPDTLPPNLSGDVHNVQPAPRAGGPEFKSPRPDQPVRQDTGSCAGRPGHARTAA